MAGIRSLNVIYGASFVFDIIEQCHSKRGSFDIQSDSCLISITCLGFLRCVFSYLYPDLSQQKRNNQRILKSKK